MLRNEKIQPSKVGFSIRGNKHVLPARTRLERVPMGKEIFAIPRS